MNTYAAPKADIILLRRHGMSESFDGIEDLA